MRDWGLATVYCRGIFIVNAPDSISRIQLRGTVYIKENSIVEFPGGLNNQDHRKKGGKSKYERGSESNRDSQLIVS